MTYQEAITEVKFNMSTIGLNETAKERVTTAKEMAVNALEIMEVMANMNVPNNFILTADDYQYLYGKMKVNYIPAFIKEKIDNGEDLSFVHQFIVKSIIHCEKNGIEIKETLS